MQLLSVATARSVWLFDMNDINPKGKSFIPELFTWLKDKFKFQTFPSSPTDLDKQTNGLMFKQGEFNAGTGNINVNLGIYSDGLTAETWASTTDSDFFLQLLLQSASKDFDLAYRPEMIRTKRYISEVIVRLTPPMTNLNPKLEAYCDKLSGMFKRANLGEFETTGIVFGCDTSHASYKPPGFAIERKADAPFSENRFYSKSPFNTEDHLKALAEFEKLIA
jgi:hypothetical protein